MLLAQMAWERLARRDPMAGSPCTASSAAPVGMEGIPGGGQQAQEPQPPLPAPVQERLLPVVGERHMSIGKTFLGILCYGACHSLSLISTSSVG